MARDLADFGRRVANTVDDAALRAMRRAAGEAAKDAALGAAASKLGGDRRMSGFRDGVALSAEYTIAGDEVRVEPTPAGRWKLADQGRRSSGVILPRRRQAVTTPLGPRAWSTYGRSRGTGVWREATERAGDKVPGEVFDEFQAGVARAMRGG